MKLKHNLLLALSLFIFAFLSCNRQSEEEKRKSAIAFFIMEQLEDYRDYEPADFQKIDNDFLLTDKQIEKSLLTVQDTLRQKLALAQLVELDFSLEKMSPWSKPFKPDQIDEYLKATARFDRKLSSALANNTSQLNEIKAEEKLAITLLNERLSVFNLSVYGIDLSGEKNVHYLHTFTLNGLEETHVFELDTETLDILSVMALG